MLELNLRPESRREPEPKRQKIETIYSLENYPSELITQIVFHAILQENSDFVTAGHYSFALKYSSYAQCIQVNKKWNLCTETAAIYFSHCQTDGLGFSFLKVITSPTRMFGSEDLEEERLLSLLKRRGPEMNALSAEHIIDEELFEYSKYMPNLKTLYFGNRVEQSTSDLRRVFKYNTQITRLNMENFSFSMLPFAFSLPNLEHLAFYGFDEYDSDVSEDESDDQYNNDQFKRGIEIEKYKFLESFQDLSNSNKLKSMCVHCGGLSSESIKRLLPILEIGFKALTFLEVTLENRYLYDAPSPLPVFTLFNIRTNLETLYLNPNFKIDLPSLTRALPNLKRLSCYLNDLDLFTIRKNFTKLEYLNLEWADVSFSNVVWFASHRTEPLQINLNKNLLNSNWQSYLPLLPVDITFTTDLICPDAFAASWLEGPVKHTTILRTS